MMFGSWPLHQMLTFSVTIDSLRVEFVAATLTNNNSSPSASSSPVVLTFLSAPQTCACPASCDESNLAHRWLGFFAALLERVAWLRARFSADTYSSFVPRAFEQAAGRAAGDNMAVHQGDEGLLRCMHALRAQSRTVHLDDFEHRTTEVNPLKSSEISREAAGRRSWRAYQDDRQVSATDFCISSP
ncbi:hypothetical protein PF008_g22864 [Phytophthora fragariae]|uniref:Uncharacterized protein n=1 Tax=Phytophthora fragariae TaxID=53985 RepID=A0A6G0QSH1_9STRA|nr:hypothetical protein PF008_g22864 [Phytophthora fragariae]